MSVFLALLRGSLEYSVLCQEQSSSAITHSKLNFICHQIKTLKASPHAPRVTLSIVQNFKQELKVVKDWEY